VCSLSMDFRAGLFLVVAVLEGLGLSLSYDIIKAHGGEIKVESKEVEGTTFIVQLPVS